MNLRSGRAIFVPAIVVCAAILLGGCGKKETAPKPGKTTWEDVTVGTGREVADWDAVYVLYRGTLQDGTQFDGNLDNKAENIPLVFTPGQHGVIEGWEKGIIGMKEGGVRTLKVAWNEGYGPGGNEKIPPYADLNFEIHLLYVVKKGHELEFDFNDDKVGTGAEAKAGDKVAIHYVGSYLTGKKFDSSKERSETPVTFTLSPSELVIPGIRDGVLGMKVGGRRTIVMPPDLAFGGGGSKNVTGQQALKFVIDLVSVNGQ